MDKVIENSTDNVSSGGSGWNYGAFLSDIPARTVTLQNSSDLKTEIQENESELRETILNQTISQDKEFRALQQEVLRGHYENRLDNEKQTRRVFEKVDRESDQIKEQLRNFEKSIDNKFSEIEKREDAREISRLKTELADVKTAVTSEGIVNKLISALAGRVA